MTTDRDGADQFAQQVADRLYAREHADEVNARAGDQQVAEAIHATVGRRRANDDNLAEVLARVAAEGHVES